LVVRYLLQIQAKTKEEVRELDVVDRGQRVDFENAGYGIRVFQLGKPGIGNLEFLVFLFFRNSLTYALNITRCDSQADAQFAKLFASPR
jgi:hypothetical protein